MRSLPSRTAMLLKHAVLYQIHQRVGYAMDSLWMKFALSVWLVLCAGPLTVSAETGVTKNDIFIGMSTVLSGPNAYLGTNFRAGTEAYLKTVNDRGGVHGRKIRLIVYDDGYEPNRAVANVKRLIIEDGVYCLLGNVGTPTTVAIQPILGKEMVPLFAPFTGAGALRNPVSPYLLHYRASYAQEVEEFLKGAVDVLGRRKIAVFYQNDAYGIAVFDTAKAALARRGMQPVASGTYTRNFEDVTQALKTLLEERPDVVIMAGTSSACAKFIIGWRRQYFLGGKKQELNPIFMNVSFVGPDRLAMLLEKVGDYVVVTQVVPPVTNEGNRYPAVTEYVQALTRSDPDMKPGSVSLEGFLAAKVFVEILKRAGADPTRGSFLAAAESLKDLDIHAGNTISYSTTNHQGSQMVYPTVLRNGSLQLLTDWKAFEVGLHQLGSN